MCSRGDPALLLFLDIFLDDKETIVRFLGDKVNAFELDRFLDDKKSMLLYWIDTLNNIFDSANVKKTFGPNVSASVITETRGLEEKDRIKVICQILRR